MNQLLNLKNVLKNQLLCCSEYLHPIRHRKFLQQNMVWCVNWITDIHHLSCRFVVQPNELHYLVCERYIHYAVCFLVCKRIIFETQVVNVISKSATECVLLVNFTLHYWTSKYKITEKILTNALGCATRMWVLILHWHRGVNKCCPIINIISVVWCYRFRRYL